MSSTLREDLAAQFGPEEHKTFEGRGGRQFTYVEDETVMDRLDDVVGVGNWQIVTEPQPIYEGVVKVRLGVRFPGQDWVWYEDFGYPNNKDGDALKEAVSDGIRRVGRYIGIARYLYRKTPTPTVSGIRTSAATPARPAPPRSTTHVPDDFADLDWDHLSPAPPNGGVATAVRPPLVALAEGEDSCPVHGVPWVLKPAGTSKTGKAYGAFWACPSDTRPYCTEKPTGQWVKSRRP